MCIERIISWYYDSVEIKEHTILFEDWGYTSVLFVWRQTMELNKYQSLKKPVDKQSHLLMLMQSVGELSNVYQLDENDIDRLTLVLGDLLEHIASIATLNNISLDTVAGLSVNSYQPELHKVINKGDVVMYNKQKYIVHDIISNQVLIANQTNDLVVDIKDIGR